MFLATRPTRTLLDLAAVLDVAELAGALDSAVRDERVSVPSLERMLTSDVALGRRGTGTLRELIADRQAHGFTRSRAEHTLDGRLVARGLPQPQRNFVVRDAQGRRLGEVDLAWPEYKVALEFQSYRHHFDRAQWRRDQTKHNRLLAAGWLVIPATAHELGTGFDELVALLFVVLGSR